MERRHFFLVIGVILLFVVSCGFVILQQGSIFSGLAIGTTYTLTEPFGETSIEYVNKVQSVQATSTILNSDPPTTIYVPHTSTVTLSRFHTIEEFAPSRDYIMVGGQNGTWFSPSQYPRLMQIFSDSNSSAELPTMSGKGTVWGGGTNGTEWLLSGWGVGGVDGKSNPYLYLYDGANPVNESIEDASEAEWAGGDIFAVTSNGTGWMVSGMGSGVLNPHAVTPGRKGPFTTNHLSLGFFDGSKFTDYSTSLPEQMDGILYANAFDGSAWLVGGGYLNRGVLFMFEGGKFVDLTSMIKRSVPSFSSVQSIAWNGKYWLIGGIGFLSEYDGIHFVDLTRDLIAGLPAQISSRPLQSVNALAWNGTTWLLGGGEPVAVDVVSSTAWLAVYNSSRFIDLTTKLPSYAIQSNFRSSVLTISYNNYGRNWIVGGYAEKNHAMLVEYQGVQVSDLSNLTGDMSYVNWAE